MIKRQNILGLIAGNRGYHSCILASYSFDFIFFEQRVLPELRRSGIQNINLLVDAGRLQQAIEDTPFDLLSPKRSYSLTPVVMKGAFHPKIILAVGKKNGFLGIGSGNLTGPGLSSNDEIWAAFFRNGEASVSNPMFQWAGHYLQKFFDQANGVNRDKLAWVETYATWYAALLKRPPINEPLPWPEGRIEFLGTAGDRSLYGQITDRLPPGPDRIQILSPYYNRDGRLLTRLNEDLQPGRIHALVDPDFGTVPTDLAPADNMLFSPWEDIEKGERFKNARLHAKAIQFEYPDQTWLLFGSPNATIEALGDGKMPSRNAEAALLIKQDSPTDHFTDLGIPFPKKGKALSEIPERNDQWEESKTPNFKLRLHHAELELNELHLFLQDGQMPPETEAGVFELGVFGCKKFPIKISGRKGLATLPESLLDNLVKVALYRGELKVSNTALIQQAYRLRQTNPDTRLAKFNELIQRDDFSKKDFTELLEYVQFSQQSVSLKAASTGSEVGLKAEQEIEEAKDPISEEAFHRGADMVGTDEYYDSLTRTEGALNELGRFAVETEDLTESQERAAMEAEDGGSADDSATISVKNQMLTYLEGEALKRSIYRALGRVTNYHSNTKKQLLNTKGHNKELSITDLESVVAVLIGLHLILMFRRDSYTEERSLVKLRRTDLSALEALEKDFGLLKPTQEGNQMDEISYTVREDYLEKLKDRIEDEPTLTLLYHDRTPSAPVEHFYFDNTEWPKSWKKQGPEQFIIEGLGGFLLLLHWAKPELSERNHKRWDLYLKRMFFRSILVLLTYRWPRHAERTYRLLLYNLLQAAWPTGMDVKAIMEELNRQKEDWGLGEVISAEEMTSLEQELRAFWSWKDRFRNRPDSLKKSADKLRKGDLVVSKRYGVMAFEKQRKNSTMDFYSPLGKKGGEQFFGFQSIYIGKNLNRYE